MRTHHHEHTERSKYRRGGRALSRRCHLAMLHSTITLVLRGARTAARVRSPPSRSSFRSPKLPQVEHFQQAPADRGESVRNQVGEVVGQLSASHQPVEIYTTSSQPINSQ